MELQRQGSSMADHEQKLIDSMIRHPVIAAVRNVSEVQQALASPVKIIFLLAGSINDLASTCQLITETGKTCFLHLDLIAGLKPDQSGIQYIAEQVRPGGIITTRPAGIKWAKAAGLLTVQRIFLLDSTALHDGRRNIRTCRPDLVEVLPGVAETAIRMAVQQFERPLIAGGLISQRSEVLAALAAGALAVSTGKRELWTL